LRPAAGLTAIGGGRIEKEAPQLSDRFWYIIANAIAQGTLQRAKLLMPRSLEYAPRSAFCSARSKADRGLATGTNAQCR
jgi:hypothetical protein